MWGIRSLRSAVRLMACVLTFGAFLAAPALAAPRAYIANTGSASVSVVDTGTFTNIATIPVGASPQSVAALPNGTRVYIGNSLGGTVSVIDTQTLTVIATIVLGSNPVALASTPDSATVYAGCADGNIRIITVATGVVSGTLIAAGTLPRDLAVTFDGARLYAIDGPGEDVNVFNTATNALITSIALPVGAAPMSVTIMPNGNRAYVANSGTNNVSIIDNTLGVPAIIGAPLAVGNDPHATVFTWNSSKAYVTNNNDNTVSVINTAVPSVSTTIGVGVQPIGIDITADGSTIFVVNAGASSVSRINPTTDTAIAGSVAVGGSPNAIGRFISVGQGIPTLSQWAMIALGLMLAGVGVVVVRRRAMAR